MILYFNGAIYIHEQLKTDHLMDDTNLLCHKS